MSESEKDNNVSLKDKRDKMIGRFILKKGHKDQAQTECPSLEDIAAFIDGMLEPSEREKIMSHLTVCKDCYEALAKTVKTQEDLSIQSKAIMKKVMYYSIPAVAAIAALLLIVFIFGKDKELSLTAKKKGTGTRQEESEYSPASPPQMIGALTRKSDIKTLAEAIKEPQSSAYGFSPSLSLEKSFFRIGVYLTDLEVALLAEDKDKAIDLLQRLLALLQPLEGTQELIPFYKDMVQKIEQNVPPKQFTGKSYKLEDIFKGKDAFLYLKFGEWAEGGRLAVVVKKTELLGIKPVQYFRRNLEGKGLPKGIFAGLEEIEEISKKEKITERDFGKLGKAFDVIINIM